MTVLLASGGVYIEGAPIRVTDVTFIAAGGAKAVDLGEIGREDFLDRFEREIATEAA